MKERGRQIGEDECDWEEEDECDWEELNVEGGAEGGRRRDTNTITSICLLNRNLFHSILYHFNFQNLQPHVTEIPVVNNINSIL